MSDWDKSPWDVERLKEVMTAAEFRQLYQQQWPPCPFGERECAILRAADESDTGRYLLPRRHGKPRPGDEKDENNMLYAACDALVNNGAAKWLSPYSDAAPGIRLTSQGYRLAEALTRQARREQIQNDRSE